MLRNFPQTNAENLYKGAAWNSSKRDKVFERFSLVFVCLFFQITFDLLLTNTSRLDTLKYTDQPIWLWFLLMTSRQTDDKFEYGMVS